MIDVVEQLKCTIVRSKNYREISTRAADGSVTCTATMTHHSAYQSACIIATALVDCLYSVPFLARLMVVVVAMTGYFKFRADLHGESMIYKWTMMENHVLYLPSLLERSLSYAQYHYLYLFKLVYPMELCFDYGYACIPTVHSLADPLNLRPLLAYSVILALVLVSVYHLRVNLMIGLVLLVVPLMPALNVLMPVGTLLAERLLFIPSIGFCIIVGELLTVDTKFIWDFFSSPQVTESTVEGPQKRLQAGILSSPATPSKRAKPGLLGSPAGKEKKAVRFEEHSKVQSPPQMSSVCSPLKTSAEGKKLLSKKTQGFRLNVVYLLLLPICWWWGRRVISRNLDWHDEYRLYESGLDVCPRSLKVLTNFAVLSMARGQYDTALEVALRATDIYPDQVAALINAGVAYQKLGKYPESVDQFQRCLQVDPKQAKAAGYLGVSYFHWSNLQSSEGAVQVLRAEALKWLLQAIDLGFQAPAILHLTGSTVLDLGRSEDAVMYYEAALRQSANYAAYYQGGAKNMPILLEDDVQPAATLNQLGAAYWELRRTDEAIDAYQRGLLTSPGDVPMLTNLGNIYREQGDVQHARETFQLAIEHSGPNVPPALLNNLGLLELNTNNYAAALDRFQQALQQLFVEMSVDSGGGQSVSAHGSAEETIRNNIRRAQDGLSRR